LFYSRTEPVTHIVTGFIERLQRAAQKVLGGRMWLSGQWLRITNLDITVSQEKSLFLTVERKAEL